VKSVYLSLDPAMRGWMADRRSYMAPLEIGEVMRGSVVGQVVESKHKGFAPGDIVECRIGWQQYAAVHAASWKRSILRSHWSWCILS